MSLFYPYVDLHNFCSYFMCKMLNILFLLQRVSNVVIIMILD